MNRIVREHYPVAELPEDLREGFEPNEKVRVIIEPETRRVSRPDKVTTLEELFARADAHLPKRSIDEIAAEIRRQRDEWDD
jgi:hypothetical protein